MKSLFVFLHAEGVEKYAAGYDWGSSDRLWASQNGVRWDSPLAAFTHSKPKTGHVNLKDQQGGGGWERQRGEMVLGAKKSQMIQSLVCQIVFTWSYLFGEYDMLCDFHLLYLHYHGNTIKKCFYGSSSQVLCTQYYSTVDFKVCR